MALPASSPHVYGVENFLADASDIDKFHQAAAKTYRAVPGHLAPKELLDSADSVDIRDTCFDGQTATELAPC